MAAESAVTRAGPRHRQAPADAATHHPGLAYPLERAVAFATTGFEAEHRLLPLLRRLASDRLAAAHGVDMEQQPEKAAALLGAEAWALIGPTHDPGPTPPRSRLDRIERLVAALERL